MLLRHGSLTKPIREALARAGAAGMTIDELVVVMRPLVPPENAIREYRQANLRYVKARRPGVRRPAPSMADQVTLGLKYLIRRTLYAPEFSTEVERMPERRHRLKPLERQDPNVRTRYADDAVGRHVHHGGR